VRIFANRAGFSLGIETSQKVSKVLAILFARKSYVIKFDKILLGPQFGRFFTSISGHPVGNSVACLKKVR
jgi:hypothetical protein